MNCETCKHYFLNRPETGSRCAQHLVPTEPDFYCEYWIHVDPTETRKQAAKAVIALVEDE